MPPPGYKEITPRDLQVLKWIAIGEERDVVAERLGISRPAVNRHMAKVMKLTATANSTAAVAHVMALGLLRPGDVTSRNAYERMERAATLAPDVMRGLQSGNARLPIPSPRRDPDAPRVPEQPERDDR